MCHTKEGRISEQCTVATVTPSFVTLGEPKLFSMTTFRPFGPIVTLTAFASVFTPWRIFPRAISEKRISLAIIFAPESAYSCLRNDAEDVVLAHDEVFGAFDFDFRARVLAEQHNVLGLDG